MVKHFRYGKMDLILKVFNKTINLIILVDSYVQMEIILKGYFNKENTVVKAFIRQYRIVIKKGNGMMAN